MDKTRNYCHVVLRTDNADNPGIDGLTNFWVMGAQKQDGMLPAQVAIREAFAQRLCSMIAAEGDALITAVKAAGILEENKINLTALRKCFKTHAVVLQGHLPNASWPRQKRKYRESVDSILCTCLEFVMHADCEHVVFVKGLKGDINLNAIPRNRPRGRKRKLPETDET